VRINYQRVLQVNWLYAASVLSAITALLHIVGGGKTTAQPLLESSLNDRAKYTNYYCWHIVTIVIIAMAVCFFLAARHVEYRELGILSTALSFAFAIWSCLLIFTYRRNKRKVACNVCLAPFRTGSFFWSENCLLLICPLLGHLYLRLG